MRFFDISLGEVNDALLDYPHWDMKPALKRYYLMHASYWVQQIIVLVLRIEKPRKDFTELVAHHIVTLWLIGYAGARFMMLSAVLIPL